MYSLAGNHGKIEHPVVHGHLFDGINDLVSSLCTTQSVEGIKLARAVAAQAVQAGVGLKPQTLAALAQGAVEMLEVREL